MKNLILKLDMMVDRFWLGVVLAGLHKMVAAYYRKRANDVQEAGVYSLFPRIPRERIAKLRHQSKRHSLEAQLIKECLK